MFGRGLTAGSVRLSAEIRSLLSACTSPRQVLAARIVLLESAILTHGLPYPANVRMAERVQAIIRAAGAIPATVGVVGGQLHVGLSDQAIEWLARPDVPTVKVSRRDLAHGLTRGVHGGTTVAGTLVAAALCHPAAALPLFVTGGVGGVHRGGQSSLDVSADLVEMGRSATTVISAGVKSILDIGRTLEYLETQGVCVATLGDTSDFPAFFTRQSGFQSPMRVTDIAEAARLVDNHQQLGLQSGVLLGVPIPEGAEAPSVESAIQAALEEASAAGIQGRDVTPFVLRRVNELTHGESLKANLALIENNAQVGAEIAVELAAMNRSDPGSTTHIIQSPPQPGPPRPIVVGGSIYDLVTHVDDSQINLDGSTHLGSVDFSFGGVGRNIADALALFDVNPIFISAVGDDNLGHSILAHNPKLDKTHIEVLANHRTAMYNLVLDAEGEARLGVGDMTIHEQITPTLIKQKMSLFADHPPMLIMDGNLSQEALNHLLQIRHAMDIPVFYEPTDVRKADKFLNSGAATAVTYFSPNFRELLAVADTMPEDLEEVSDDDDLQRRLHQAVDICLDMLTLLEVVLVTLGDDGVLVVRRGSSKEPLPLRNDPLVKSRSEFTVSAVHYPVRKICDAVSVSGAGDCLSAAFIVAILEGRTQGQAVAAGVQAAAFSLADTKSVPEILSRDIIDWEAEARGIRIL